MRQDPGFNQCCCLAQVAGLDILVRAQDRQHFLGDVLRQHVRRHDLRGVRSRHGQKAREQNRKPTISHGLLHFLCVIGAQPTDLMDRFISCTRRRPGHGENHARGPPEQFSVVPGTPSASSAAVGNTAKHPSSAQHFNHLLYFYRWQYMSNPSFVYPIFAIEKMRGSCQLAGF